MEEEGKKFNISHITISDEEENDINTNDKDNINSFIKIKSSKNTKEKIEQKISELISLFISNKRGINKKKEDKNCIFSDEKQKKANFTSNTKFPSFKPTPFQIYEVSKNSNFFSNYKKTKKIKDLNIQIMTYNNNHINKNNNINNIHNYLNNNDFRIKHHRKFDKYKINTNLNKNTHSIMNMTSNSNLTANKIKKDPKVLARLKCPFNIINKNNEFKKKLSFSYNYFKENMNNYSTKNNYSNNYRLFNKNYLSNTSSDFNDLKILKIKNFPMTSNNKINKNLNINKKFYHKSRSYDNNNIKNITEYKENKEVNQNYLNIMKKNKLKFKNFSRVSIKLNELGSRNIKSSKILLPSFENIQNIFEKRKMNHRYEDNFFQNMPLTNEISRTIKIFKHLSFCSDINNVTNNNKSLSRSKQEKED